MRSFRNQTLELPLKIALITIFPEIFQALNYGIVGRAIRDKLIDISYWNPRHYTTDVHHTVDDRPYGGGPGMVMKFEPLAKAIQAAKTQLGANAKVIHLSPQGKSLTQQAVHELISDHLPLILIAGRYEGIDERLIEELVDEEWSVGDYVVSGGEIPAMILIDAMTRLLPGALGHAESAPQDSFSSGLLDYPHYTRPESIGGQAVPDVLLSGDHAAIARWRLKQALGRTWQRRPDLIKRRSLTKQEQALLDEFIIANSRDEETS